MAVGTRLTLAGALLLSKAITGKKLEFTRGALGNARINDVIIEPTDEQMDNLDSLIHEKMSVPIAGYELKDGGDISITVRIKNDSVASNFQIREIGLFAKDPDTQAEVLYGYYFDYYGDKMHATSSYVTLEYYLELITTIANAQNVTCNVVVTDKVKPGIGLSRNVDTINFNLGTGLSLTSDNKVAAQIYTLPTASPTVKGGIMIGKNLTLTGDSLNAADPYKLPTGSTTVKGGFMVGKNLYLTGDSLNCSVEPYDDSLLTSRLNQLEINQSNIYMKLNADFDLGITANLLLVEDFIKCDCLNLYQVQASGTATDSTTHSKRINVRDKVNGFNDGYYVTLVEGGKSCDKVIFNITGTPVYNSDDYSYHVSFEGESGELENMSKPIMYRTTAAIANGVAYGPGDISNGYHAAYTWKGTVNITSYPATLNTAAGQEANFDLSGEFALTSDGFFTLA